MKLVTFTLSSTPESPAHVGACDDGDATVADLTDGGLADSMESFIRMGKAGLDKARAYVMGTPKRYALADIVIGAPISRPAKNIMCVGKNYYAHAVEFHSSGFDASSAAGAAAVPDKPVIFTKAHTSIAAPGAVIDTRLDPTGSTDYEGELAVVIGVGGRGIARDRALEHVYGYTIVNDVTARTIQHAHKQWFLGKSIDGYCPMGPCLVTADEIEDVEALELVTTVNGEVRQKASVADLVFDIPMLIETISHGIRLEPGDVIATGTPAGVGIGFDPPRYLKAGDSVAVTIEPIGTLTNPVS
ncbi:fumarylacetoacetate hydrolase family protein [Fodinicurvata sp. EGI_FJ10296]|uniref:fumarylacetoacetate hydrolase family protein n=1 Tax=Fodinicurvata sp. EGI_FJ10296 TaxID=3231908 RepID=UPI003452F4CA